MLQSEDCSSPRTNDSICVRLHSSKRDRLQPFLCRPHSRSSRSDIPAQFGTGSAYIKMETMEAQDVHRALRLEACQGSRALSEIGLRQSVHEETTLGFGDPFDWWGALRARVTIPPQR